MIKMIMINDSNDDDDNDDDNESDHKAKKEYCDS